MRTPALVLLVSPDRLTREVIGGWLVFNGYRVFAAASVAEALRAMPAAVGLAILDLEYSCGAVTVVLDKIRDSFPEVPMIVLTGCPEEAVAAARAINNGPVAALPKHGSLQSLRQAVEDCLSRS